MSETDVFTAVTNLIALIADPKAAGKRMSELQQQVERAEAAAAKLETTRQAHDQKVAADRAALEARTAVLVKREADLAGREGRMEHYDKVIARWKKEHDFVDGDIQPGSTLRREPHHA
jgi:Skp family chaperone for outer membrane proteins